MSTVTEFLTQPIKTVQLNSLSKTINSKLESEFMDDILNLLLRMMKLLFALDKGYRRNIENFEASYVFVSSGTLVASVKFSKGKMTVLKSELQNPNIKVFFKDGHTIKNFLLSDNPDIISLMLANELSYIGNINYVMKFAYMATHIKVKLEGKASVTKLPRKNSKLTNLFINGKPVEIDELQNEYYVEMITGFVPNFIKFNHRKRFYKKDGKPYGNNIIFRNYNFGYFDIEENQIKVPGDDETHDVLILNYHNKRNFIWRGMVDQIRCLEYQKLYLGRYNLHFFGKLRFVGYFALTLKK